MTKLLLKWLTHWLTKWPTDWLAYWVADWSTDRQPDGLIDWLTLCLTDRQTLWLNDWKTDSLTDWQTDPLTDWMTDWLTYCPINRPPTDWPNARVTNLLNKLKAGLLIVCVCVTNWVFKSLFPRLHQCLSIKLTDWLTDLYYPLTD